MRSRGLYEENHNGNLHHLTRRDRRLGIRANIQLVVAERLAGMAGHGRKEGEYQYTSVWFNELLISVDGV